MQYAKRSLPRSNGTGQQRARAGVPKGRRLARLVGRCLMQSLSSHISPKFIQLRHIPALSRSRTILSVTEKSASFSHCCQRVRKLSCKYLGRQIDYQVMRTDVRYIIIEYRLCLVEEISHAQLNTTTSSPSPPSSSSSSQLPPYIHTHTKQVLHHQHSHLILKTPNFAFTLPTFLI